MTRSTDLRFVRRELDEAQGESSSQMLAPSFRIVMACLRCSMLLPASFWPCWPRGRSLKQHLKLMDPEHSGLKMVKRMFTMA